MRDIFSILTEAIMECLKKYGLIPTVLVLVLLLFALSLLVLVWQLPEIIIALKS